MSKAIKNLQLISDSKPQLNIHQKPFRLDQRGFRPQDLNLWKIFSKIPKTSSYKDQERDREREKSEDPFNLEDQRLIVISTFKGRDHTGPESPNKPFRVYRNPIKRYVSDEGFNFPMKMTSHQKIQKPNEGSASCSPIENQSQNINGEEVQVCQKSVEYSLYKRSALSGNSSELKTKYRINNRESSRKPTKAMKMTPSKVKLPELKEEKKFPVLTKDAEEMKEIKSESYILIEFPSERMIVGHRSSVSLQIASLTKIMTYYTVMQFVQEQGIDIKSQKIIVSEEVYSIGGTSAQLSDGEEYSVEEMLYGLMLPSGNDAANELGYWMGAYLINCQDNKARLKAFVAEMNKNARSLDLKNTKFANPHGLPSHDARSTAFDMAKLSGICMKQELFRTIVGCKIFKITVKNGSKTRQVAWENTNKLLRREGFIGIKTGITVTAGPCLATAYSFREKVYICIVLRANKVSGRFKQTRLLLNWSLNRLYKDLTESERHTLRKLRKNNQDLDSDYSEDEHEFKYNCGDASEYRRRCNILKYEM